MDATLTTTPHVGQFGTALTLFAVAGGLIVEGLTHLPAFVMALGALLGGIASLLPAVSAFLDGRQRRRQAAEEHRRRRQAA